jgi:hypothetical protein
MSFRNLFGLFILFGAVAIIGCKQEAPQPAPRHIDFRKPLPEGMVALRKIDPSEYPDFAAQPIDPVRLSRSIDSSLKYLSAPSSRTFFPYLDIDHQRAVATLHRLHDICNELMAMGRWDSTWFNQQIRANFEVYKSYGAPSPDGSGYTDTVLFTGYCTPIYDASLKPTAEFQWPLYKLPADLVRDEMSGAGAGAENARWPDRAVLHARRNRNGTQAGWGRTGLAQEPVGSIRGDDSGIGAASPG